MKIIKETGNAIPSQLATLPENLPDPPKSGEVCPTCRNGKLDYNGLLELECPACGDRFGSGAGYT
jgi:hypothetical protein